jgi:hypothetical protein
LPYTGVQDVAEDALRDRIKGGSFLFHVYRILPNAVFWSAATDRRFFLRRA